MNNVPLVKIVEGKCKQCGGTRDGHFHVDPKSGTILADTRFAETPNGLDRAVSKISK